MCCILVLPAFIRIHVFYYRQQIGTSARIVLVDDLLHRSFPFDEKQLARLLPAIREDAILQVLLFQIGHIYERHSACVERKHEDVPGEVHNREQRQIEFLDLTDDFQRYGSFDGLVDSCIDMFERTALPGQFLFDGTVVDCPQSPHIIRRGIRTRIIRMQKDFIFDHQIGFHLVQRYVLLPAKPPETVQNGRITLGSTCSADLFQLPDKFTAERHESSGVC